MCIVCAYRISTYTCDFQFALTLNKPGSGTYFVTATDVKVLVDITAQDLLSQPAEALFDATLASGIVTVASADTPFMVTVPALEDARWVPL